MKRPATSRGRDKHVIALLVVPDAVAFEVAVVQQIFGRRIESIAAITGYRDSPYEVVLCGEKRRQVLPSGADLGELAPLETMLTADTVMVPGVEDPLAPRSAVLLEALRDAHAAGARMVSYCGGAFVLGRAGLLDGRRATTHWLFSAEFRAEFPLARLEAENLYVDDGLIHTSGGLFSATDLALHLLALDLGQAYANDAGRLLVTAPRRPGGQAQFIKSSLRADDQPPLDSLLHWIREHLDEPLTLARLAAYEHVSERSLVRKFRQATGMSVFDWISTERVSRAKLLLETTGHPVAEIAAMAGFGSSETLRRNFEKHAGTTPAAYRATFRADSAGSVGRLARSV
ncbi:helix-turn-helix domain-containing protein [Kribbella sancticallisti]|uniref:Helix-turn-helix domain-containing protein n=1 Tax=Kribbella sancticallisti TaxID=460087 RepID=A0ABN2ESS9_9ACTN